MAEFSDTPLFEEKQRFRQFWLWGIMGLTNVIMMVAILADFFSKGDIFSNLASFIMVLVFWLLLAGMMAFISRVNLKTQVHHDGWYYKFWPFHRNKFKVIKWEDVERFEIKRYNPLWEFGGWGYRKGLGKSGDAYNIQGNIGFQLFLKNGKKILFGTQSPEELKIALEHLFTDEEEISHYLDLKPVEEVPLYSKVLREDLQKE